MSRRKRYDGQFKAQVAIEAIKNQQTTAQIASEYGVHPNQVSQWKKQVLDQLPQLFTNGRSKATADSDQLVDELYRQIGQLKVEEVIHFDRVPLPKMPVSGPAWGADGKSILFTTKPADGPWNIYRFRLTDRKLIQLTHHVRRDSGPHEWNPRLSVQPQRLLPMFWGEIKSNRLRH